MNEAQLQAKLTELLALPAETEWVEFKEARNNVHFDDIGKYFSALSNEANLKCQACAWLVLGVQDKPIQIKGSNYRPKRPELDSLKEEIANQTTNRLTFEEIYEVARPEGRAVMFQIPPALRGVPTAWKGHYYGRDHEALVPLSLHEIEQIRKQRVVEDWSSQIVDGANLNDFDPAAIRRAREVYRIKHPKFADEVDGWGDVTFLNRFLVDAMVNLNMIDTIGSGIRRSFGIQRERNFPMPTFDLSETARVKVRAIGQILDPNFTRMLIARTDLRLEDVIALDKVQKGYLLSDEEFQSLKAKRLIEGRRPKLHVSAEIAKATDTVEDYLRRRGIDKAYCEKMVVDFLRTKGSASRAEIIRLLAEKLSDALSESQKRNFIRNLLQEMRREQTIVVDGRGPKTKWRLAKGGVDDSV